jgi:lysozyme
MINCAIDVSHHQGEIDWPALPSAIKCVMIKATQGASYVDPQFKRNFTGVVDAGLFAIPYHFLDNSDVHRQFMHFKSVVDLSPGMVVALDWETVSRSEKRPPTSVMEAIGESCKLVTGRNPLAYHGMYDLSSRKINEWPWWIPKYGPEPKPSIKWLFWQYTQQGKMTGVKGSVDRSMFWGSVAELNAWHERNVLPRGL